MKFLRHCRLLTAAVLNACVLMAVQAQPAPNNLSAGDRIHPLEVTVNGAKAGTWVFVEKGGALYAPADAFDEWRINRRPGALAVDLLGAPHYPLDSVPGFGARTDFSALSVALTFAPEAFSATRVVQEGRPSVQVDPALPSGFLNYDFSYNRSALTGVPLSASLGMLGELGLSGPWGLFTTSFAGRDLASSGPAASHPKLTRLESTFVRNFPESSHSLRLGDTSTAPSLMGRRTYFGGIQVGSNFALNPGFLTQPQPSLGGLSAAPSTVELYINDVLRQVSSVPTGPFALENLPMLTDNGQARLVVRDLLGRETVVVSAFLTSPQLLAPGLNDWNLSAGRLRSDLGQSGTRYGPNFAAGLWRRGLSPRLTVEGAAELEPGLRTVGLGAVSALPGQILGRAGWAASQSDTAGAGQQWLIGTEYQGLRTSTSLQAQGASAGYRQLGQAQGAPRLQLAASSSLATRDLGSFGLGFAAVQQRATALQPATRVVTGSLNYSRRLGPLASLNFNLSRAWTRQGGLIGALGQSGGTAWGLTLVRSFGKQVVASTTAQGRSGDTELTASAAQAPASDFGLGWRLLAGQQRGSGRTEGGLFQAGPYGNVQADLSASSDQTALRLGATGALVAAGGQLFATPRIDASYALVELPGYPDVGVGLGSSILTRTNAQGAALVTRLVPYQTNYVRLDASELPFSAEVESLEKTAVPGQRGAVKVAFAVRGGRSALLRVVLDDGEPAPVGAVIRIEGDDAETFFYVARRGEAYVTGMAPRQRLALAWRGKSCALEVVLPPATEDIPRLGPLACQGVVR